MKIAKMTQVTALQTVVGKEQGRCQGGDGMALTEHSDPPVLESTAAKQRFLVSVLLNPSLPLPASSLPFISCSHLCLYYLYVHDTTQ